LCIVATEEWGMRKTTKSLGERIVNDIKRVTCHGTFIHPEP
jgi:hypothetical protein